MKKYIYSLLFAALLIVFTGNFARGQKKTIGFQTCPNTSARTRIELEKGDIKFITCAGKKVYLNGAELGGSSNVTTGLTTNAVPKWNGTTFVNSLLSHNSTTNLFSFAGNGIFTASSASSVPLSLQLAAGQTANALNVTTSDALTKLRITANGDIDFPAMPADADAGLFARGTPMLRNVGGNVRINESNGYLYVYGAGTAFLNAFSVPKQNTAAGTTGNISNSSMQGTVNIAAGASSATVTNGLSSAGSLVVAVARTNDATCSVKSVVPANGSFVVTMTSNCTAETSVGFIVFP